MPHGVHLASLQQVSDPTLLNYRYIPDGFGWGMLACPLCFPPFTNLNAEAQWQEVVCMNEGSCQEYVCAGSRRKAGNRVQVTRKMGFTCIGLAFLIWVFQSSPHSSEVKGVSPIFTAE